MKNIVLTTERFVLPLTLEAAKESSTDQGAVMHEASQDATIIPQPAFTVNFMRKMLPISGGMQKAMATNVLFLGNSAQARTPNHNSTIWTAPEGAVFSSVWNLS
jgi:hypothetical protein